MLERGGFNCIMRGIFFLYGVFIWAALSASTSADPQSSAMVLVRGGTLPQGSELAGQVVKDFEIGKYEVTWGEWKAVRDWAVKRGYDLYEVGQGSGDNHPVRNVNWYEAVKWCNARSEKEGKTAVYEENGVVYRSGDFGSKGSAAVKMRSEADGFRLPLEAEWEWAARGGAYSKGYDYSGGNDLNEVGWHWKNSSGAVVGLGIDGTGTWPVGKKNGNELGLHDMSGNVYEWCWDLVQETAHRRERGGSFSLHSGFCRLGSRESDAPNYGIGINGFRIVRITAHGVEASVTTGVDLQNATAKLSVSPQQDVMVSVKGGTLPQVSELAGQVVGDFSIGRTEVTWGEWKSVRDWAATKGYDLAGVGGTYPENGGDSLPVVNVSWYDVVKWCNARSEKEGRTAVYQANGGVYRSGEFGALESEAVTVKSGANGCRLPVEKEWEWAARGGVSSKGYTYSGGNVVGEVAWIDENNSPYGAKAVGGKKANELGLSDMSGNVWEWVWDLRLVTSFRRIRGGSWGNLANCAEVSYRGLNDDPADRVSSLGFRVAFSSGQ